MIIKRFNKINGFYPEPISGQTRFAFSKNDFEDFYDIKEGDIIESYILEEIPR